MLFLKKSSLPKGNVLNCLLQVFPAVKEMYPNEVLGPIEILQLYAEIPSWSGIYIE